MRINIPDDAPAWVHAALDGWEYQNGGRVNGFRVLTHVYYPELAAASGNNARVEGMVFNKLEHLAYKWARADFRLWIDDFESKLSQCEIEALQNPLSMKHVGKEDSTYTWRDDAWVFAKTSQLMGQKGYIVTAHQAREMLDIVAGIYEIADYMGKQVRVLTHYEERPNSRDKTIELLQYALQKTA